MTPPRRSARRRQPATVRRLELKGGPFDGAALLDDGPPKKLCASHTTIKPADKATAEQFDAADPSQCAIYVRETPEPKTGPVAYHYDRAHPERLDLNCRFALIEARHARALAILEAHEAAKGDAKPEDAPAKELPGGDEGEEWREGSSPT